MGDLSNNLSNISNSLIKLKVNSLLNRYNLSKESKKLARLSEKDKNNVRDSIAALQEQAEKFLEDQYNKNGEQMSTSIEAIMKKLQKVDGKSN
ncbi:hypothetical protein [Aquibacillus salsiterrae]|uniref:Uncharacterized protein n=1 Tax=Aquibacillus salsiterrae TaxID=2950439 RepID=A0A9X3WII6_9BACI|nr:hypothetical protein [Aquibacillus salsiterrae]MDC3417676.1 hypothetical protein [Aquibacillus salsiterrae]